MSGIHLFAAPTSDPVLARDYEATMMLTAKDFDAMDLPWDLDEIEDRLSKAGAP